MGRGGPLVRILIVRLSSIGDVLMATPVARALRERYPDGFLAWIAEDPGREWLQGNPYLDQVIRWPSAREWRKLARGGGYRLWQTWREHVRRLRALRFDVALELHGLLKSALVCWWSRAPRRIGPTEAREGSRWLMTEHRPFNRDTTRTTAYYSTLLAPLDVQRYDLDMTLVLTEEERRWARSYLNRFGVQEGDPLAVFCPATTRPQKHWIEDYWASLAGALGREWGMRSLVLGGPADVALAQRLQARAGPYLLSAAGQTTLRQAAALIERAQLCVGVDTGLMHAGIAVKTPTVALFGSTPSRRLQDEPNVIALNRHLPCAPCYRHPTCQQRYDCMRQITVEDVLRAARHLLGGGRLEGSPR